MDPLKTISLDSAIREGWIKVEDTQLTEEFTGIAQIAGLRTAEAAMIFSAYRNSGVALLDEDPATTLALTLGIAVRGTEEQNTSHE